MTVLQDLMEGQYNSPVRVIAFNTAEGWSRDVSDDVPDEIRHRLRHGAELPANLEAFMERHENHADRAQLRQV